MPESFLLNPSCNVASPWQTSFRSLVAYTIPRIDVQLSTVLQDKPNVGTEQLGSLSANYTLTAADQAAAAAQIGRPLTATGPITVNLLQGGQLYGPRVRQWDLAAKKIIRFGGTRMTLGADFYNLLNNNVTLGFQRWVRAERTRLAVADVVHEPARLPAERGIRVLDSDRPESVARDGLRSPAHESKLLDPDPLKPLRGLSGYDSRLLTAAAL